MSGETLEDVFEDIFDLIRDRQFEKIDAILDAVDVETQSPMMLLGYLSASKPGERYLPGRVRLLARVETKLRADGVEDLDETLGGLR